MNPECEGCEYFVKEYKREYKGFVLGCTSKDIHSFGGYCYTPKGRQENGEKGKQEQDHKA